MAQTITLKQAMPTAEDRDSVLTVLHWLQTAIEENIQYDDDGNAAEISDEEIIDRLRTDFTKAGRNFGCSWQRVLYAGLCAIDNSCDPTQDVLTWKPEIARGLELVSAETATAPAPTEAPDAKPSQLQLIVDMMVNEKDRCEILAGALAECPDAPPEFVFGVQVGLSVVATLLAAGKQIDAKAPIADISQTFRAGLEEMLRKAQP